MALRKPYLIFLGDVADQLGAKTGQGIVDWRRDWCIGQLRLDGCGGDLGIADRDIPGAIAAGAGTLVIGCVNQGGFLPEHWIDSIVEGIAAGLDVASGLHQRLQEVPRIAEAANRYGRALHNVRHSDVRLSTGTGIKRRGRRLLTVGTDCSVGKKYTALALERAMRARGLDAEFRATGQTGVLIAERGIAVDAVIADFISGAVEWLSPDADSDSHWDVIEGQGSLFHAAFAGVTLGLLHGAQPDALVLCHEPTRGHMRGLPHAPLPDLRDCIEAYVSHAKLTNPNAVMIGLSVNTSALAPPRAESLLSRLRDELGIPAVDPIAGGVDPLIDRLPG